MSEGLVARIERAIGLTVHEQLEVIANDCLDLALEADKDGDKGMYRAILSVVHCIRHVATNLPEVERGHKSPPLDVGLVRQFDRIEHKLDSIFAKLHTLKIIEKSAPPSQASLPSGESGPSVTTAAGGADTANPVTQTGRVKS